MPDDRLAAAQRLFSPEGAYLNTATYGLPPRTAFEAMAAAADEWRHGRTGFDGWDALGRRGARRASRGSRAWRRATWRSAAPPRSSRGSWRPRCPTGRACSPWRATSRACCSRSSPRRRAACATELVPLDGLAGALGARRTTSSPSARCRARPGRWPTLDAMQAAAAAPRRPHVRRHDPGDGLAAARLLAASTTPRARPTSCCSARAAPRSSPSAPEHRDGLIPHAAGWYAGEDVPSSYYGAPLRLAADARRFDLSPAWLNWVGAAASLALLEDGRDRGRSTRTTWRWRPGSREGLGLPATGTAFVSVTGLPDDAAGPARARGRHGGGPRRRAAALLPPLHDARARRPRAGGPASSGAGGRARGGAPRAGCRARSGSRASP